MLQIAATRNEADKTKLAKFFENETRFFKRNVEDNEGRLWHKYYLIYKFKTYNEAKNYQKILIANTKFTKIGIGHFDKDKNEIETKWE